jgi:hypothetical protein
VSYGLSIERAYLCVGKAGLLFLAADFVSGEQQVCVSGELVSVSEEPIYPSGELVSVSGSNSPFLEQTVYQTVIYDVFEKPSFKDKSQFG